MVVVVVVVVVVLVVLVVVVVHVNKQLEYGCAHDLCSAGITLCVASNRLSTRSQDMFPQRNS